MRASRAVWSRRPSATTSTLPPKHRPVPDNYCNHSDYTDPYDETVTVRDRHCSSKNRTTSC